MRRVCQREGCCWRDSAEVRDGDTPGLLTCFVVTDDGLLQRASVKVDRRFYVDVDEGSSLKDVLQKFGARKVPRATPPTGDRPGAEVKQMYEVRVDESRENNLAALLPKLGAKYEYHTPAWFRQVCAGGGGRQPSIMTMFERRKLLSPAR